MRKPSVLVRFLLFVLALLLLAVWQPVRAEGTIRVAVVAEEEPDLEALLQAKLAARENLALLSRTDLPLLEKEAERSGSGRLKLPGVDRLVVISGKGDARAVRVTDCGSGAVVFEASLPPKLNVQESADVLGMRLPRFLQHSPRPGALRVALMGFRFPESSPGNRSLEARLNLVCAVALQESLEAVVLERWRMKDLVFENSLRPEAVGEFWNSAAMVQGAISQQGDRLIVTLETKSPGDDRGRVEKVEGLASDIPALGENLAAAILNTPLKKAGAASREAEAYLKETEWLLAHQLYLEAAQAVECAAALDPGNRNAEVMRIKVYALGAYPDPLAARQPEPVLGYGQEIKKENIGRAVTMASEMSRLAGEYMEKYQSTSQDTLEDSVSLGVRTLLTSLRVLTAVYDFDYHLEDPTGVEILRALTEKNGKTLREKSKGVFRADVDLYLTNYAGYWCATPEAALAEYRAAMGRDFQTSSPETWPVRLRIPLVKASGNNPPLLDVDVENRKAARPTNVVCRLVSWKPGGEKHARDLWEAYLDELAGSDDLLSQADALYLRWASFGGDANREKALEPILAFLEKHPDAVLGSDGRAIAQMLTAPLQSLSYIKDVNLCVRYLDILIKLFEQDVPLPYELIQRISQSYGYRRKDDIPISRFLALEKAVSGHFAKFQERGAKDGFYMILLTNALGALKGFSASASTQQVIQDEETLVASPIVVSRLWLAASHFAGFEFLSGVWHDGWLWFANDYRPLFWRIKLDTLETEKLSVPDGPDRLRGMGGDCHPLFEADQIIVAGTRDVWSFDLTTRSWWAFQLPPANYQLYKANGTIWAICGRMSPRQGEEEQDNQGTCLYRIDVKNRKASLVFSSRRRPAQHPLDSMENWAPFVIFSGPSGQPIIGLASPGKKSLWRLESGAPWTTVQSERLWDRNSREGDVLLVQRQKAPRNGWTPTVLEAVVSVDIQGQSELLLLDRDVTSFAQPPMAGEPVWKVPTSLNEYPIGGHRFHRAGLLGDRLAVLMTDEYGTTGNYTTVTELFVFRRGNDKAVRIPLRFEIPPELKQVAERGHYPPKSILNPSPHAKGFLPVPDGLVITGLWGFWFIPASDIEKALAEADQKNTGKR